MKRLDVLAKEIGIILGASLVLAFSYNAFAPKPLPLIRSETETQAPDSLISALAAGLPVTPPQTEVKDAAPASAIEKSASLSLPDDVAALPSAQTQEEKPVSSPVSGGGKTVDNLGASSGQSPVLNAPPAPKALDIRLDQLEKLLSNPDVMLIDARPAHEFEQGHISGAINIFTPDFERSIHRIIGLPREKPIVAYCGGGACELSHELAEHLTKMGFQRVFVYVGGWNEWKEKKQ